MSLFTAKPYRPSSWSIPAGPATIMISFPGAGTTPQYQPSGINTSLPTNPANYIFDCVILADHEQRARKTEHPVQTGASISDHAFIEPATLTLDIGMSDAMDEYITGSFTGQNPSKSVNAYQIMVLLMFSRIPLTIATRLRTYDTMIIESIHPQESAKTFGGLRMRIAFGQIFLASVQTPFVSVRMMDTDSSNDMGHVTPTPPTDAQNTRNSVAGLLNCPAVPSGAVGCGLWSSGDVGSLPLLPAAK